MYLFVDHYLNQWVKMHSRKPILLRGARQVGKTFSVRELGKINFLLKCIIHSTIVFYSADLFEARGRCRYSKAHRAIPAADSSTISLALLLTPMFGAPNTPINAKYQTLDRLPILLDAYSAGGTVGRRLFRARRRSWGRNQAARPTR